MKSYSIYLLIFSLFSLQACSFKTKIKIDRHSFRSSDKLENLWISKIHVKSFDSSGIPSDYTEDSVFYARNLWNLTEGETLELLNPSDKQKFLAFKKEKDSMDVLNILENRPADTIVTESGIRIYTMPGEKRPARYFIVEHEMQMLAYHIDRKLKRKIWFSKFNKQYRWIIYDKTNSTTRSSFVKTIRFTPGQWYTTRIPCSYGLFSSGYCTLYFTFDEKFRITVKRTDWKNEGPF